MIAGGASPPGPPEDTWAKMKGRAMGPVVQVLWEDWADRSLPLPVYQTAGAAGAIGSRPAVCIRCAWPAGRTAWAR